MKLTVDIEKKLPGFNLKVKFETENEVLALLGASGSGKSMTLKCIAGIERPDRGRIVLGDRILFDSEKKINLPARKRKVGYLFQDYALFGKMKVLDNIMISGISKDEALLYIKNFRLEGKESSYPDELSGGQKQRVALARMLASKPEIILLDEPYSALDNYLRSLMEREIFGVIDEFNGPVVFVSHDRNEVYRVADKIAVLDDGNMEPVRKKTEFFGNPTSVSAARLTGCKNISSVTRNGKGYFANEWGINLNLSENKTSEAAQVNYVGYRAHYFEVVNESYATNCFDCDVVRVIEDTFSTVILFKQKGYDAPEPLYFETDKEEAERLVKMINDGKNLYLKINPSKFIYLDR